MAEKKNKQKAPSLSNSTKQDSFTMDFPTDMVYTAALWY